MRVTACLLALCLSIAPADARPRNPCSMPGSAAARALDQLDAEREGDRRRGSGGDAAVDPWKAGDRYASPFIAGSVRRTSS